MSIDLLLRAGAVAVAVAILAAPHRDKIKAGLDWAVTIAKEHGGTAGRAAAALLIVAAAWGKLPVPAFTVDLPSGAEVVSDPSPEMQRLVEPVRVALAAAPPQARAAWVKVWNKAALVVEAESAASDRVFKDVPSLRILTITALDIGWRRLSGMPAGSLAGLKEGVEGALASAVGTEAKPLTDEMRASYVKVSRALAWAGAR